MSIRRQVISSQGETSIILMDSISYAGPSDRGAFAVSASHGGKSSAHIASGLPLAGVVFNDAGVGKNDAGIAGLAMLDETGMPALAVSHESACIGDVIDAWEHGTISRVNEAAGRLGFAVGQPVKIAVLAWFGVATAKNPGVGRSAEDGR